MNRENFLFFFFTILEKGGLGLLKTNKSASECSNSFIKCGKWRQGQTVALRTVYLCGTHSFTLLQPQHPAKFTPFQDGDVKKQMALNSFLYVCESVMNS